MEEKTTIVPNDDEQPLLKNPEKKIGFLNNFFGLITAIVTILASGFAMGRWVANIENNYEIVKAQSECQEKIMIERRKWEIENNNELKLNTILMILEEKKGN